MTRSQRWAIWDATRRGPSYETTLALLRCHDGNSVLPSCYWPR